MAPLTPLYQTLPGMTLSRVKEMFNYNPKTGALTWRVRRAHTVDEELFAGTIDGDPRFNAKGEKIDYSAQGGPRRSGHVMVTLYGQKIPAQRLVWFMTRGEWPTERLVCLDGDPENLRPHNWAPLSQVTLKDSKHVNARARANRWKAKRAVINVNRTARLNQQWHEAAERRERRLAEEQQRDQYRTGPTRVARPPRDEMATPRRTTRRTEHE